MLEVQQYLIDALDRGESVEFALSMLKAKYGIINRFSTKNPNLILFKYDQIESPMGERIVQECRGIILDEDSVDDSWPVVSRSFDKFFNFGEGHAVLVDWSTARVQEKLDGSLCVLYHYDFAWHVATSGSPDAAGEVGDNGFTFEELFWKTFNEKGYVLPRNSLSNVTFSFELTSKYNRIVTRQDEPNLRLIGARDRTSGIEIDPRDFSSEFDVVKHFDISSIDKLIETFSSIDPIDQEGYVVVDAKFNRIKIKHPGYVALHHLKEGFGKARILEIIRVGEKSEFLTYFPEWKDVHDEVNQKYLTLIDELVVSYESIKHISSQKEFAFEALKTRLPGAMFQVRNGKSPSFKQYLAEMNVKLLADILGIRETNLISDEHVSVS